MSTVCLASANGSPGVTTTALGLAATWPAHRRCLLIEADPFGGVIAARYGLGDTPGLASLAADSRRGLNEEAVRRHAQQLPGGMLVLVGPPTAEEALVVLRDVAGPLAGWVGTQGEVDVIIDCGRIPPGSSPIDTMGATGIVLILARPTLDQLRPAAHRATALNANGAEAALLLVGDEPYGPAEVTAALQIPVAGVVAWDPRTAAVLTGGHGAARDLRHSLLVRSAATLAERLAPAPPVEPAPGGDAYPAPLLHASEQIQEART